MKIKYLLFALIALASCSQDDSIAPDDNKSEPQGNKYSLSIKPFDMVNGGQTTRTIPSIHPDRVSYTWVTGDEIGIFPFEGIKPKGDQVWFTVTANEKDPNKATFDGGGWQIKKGMNYIAYYPFIDKFRMDPTNIEVSFVGQAVHGKDDYSNFGKYDFMVAAPKEQAAIDSGMSFEFNHVSALCVIRFQMLQKMLKDQTSGKLKRIDLILPETEKLFCETGNLDLTKGKDALTAKTTTNKISIDLTDYQIVGKNAGMIIVYEDIMIPFLQGPAQLAGKTCEVNLVVHNMSNQEIGTYTTTLKFKENLACGNGYFLNLTFPDIDVSSNKIYSYQAGSLTLDRIYKAMNGGNKLRVEGEVDFNDFELLRQAAGAPAKTTSRGTTAPASLLKDLDLEEAHFLEGRNPANPIFYDKHFDMPSMVGSQLERLSLPRGFIDINAGIFSGVPLKTLEWYYGPFVYENKLDPKAFEGLKTEECDLKVNNERGQMYQFISADENGNMLFNGCKFKSIQSRNQIWDEWGDITYEYVDIVTTTVDASAHIINAICAGFFTEAKITEALASGTELKVTGYLNDRDLTTIGTVAGATLTSLTFEIKDEFVPKAESFAGFSNSEACDLVIPEAWRSLVTNTDGKVMFANKVWKSIVADQLDGMDIGGFGGEDQDQPMFN